MTTLIRSGFSGLLVAADTTTIPPKAGVIARSSFSTLAYSTAGVAELVGAADGSLTLTFSEDFAADNVQGPVVLLTATDETPRNITGNSPEFLGILKELKGAQTYAVPQPLAANRHVWLYCLPFTVPMSRADLVEPTQ